MNLEGKRLQAWLGAVTVESSALALSAGARPVLPTAYLNTGEEGFPAWQLQQSPHLRPCRPQRGPD